MSYISQGDKIFSYKDPKDPDCTPPVPKRSEGRLKRYISTFDSRAWSLGVKSKSEYLHDLVSGSQTCLSVDDGHRYVPLDNLISILMSEKDAYIKELEDRLRNEKKPTEERPIIPSRRVNEEDEGQPTEDYEAAPVEAIEEKVQFRHQIMEENQIIFSEEVNEEKMFVESEIVNSLTQQLNNSREMLREAMHRLQNIDEIVNENKNLQTKLRCSEDRIKFLEEKKKYLESELADLRSKSQIQFDLEKAQDLLSRVTLQRDVVEMDEIELQALSLERDELQEKVKKLEKDLEESKRKENEIEMLKNKSQDSILNIEEISRENECYKKKLASMKCLEKQIQELKKHGRALADKYKREAQKSAEKMKKMNQTIRELQSLREERDCLRRRVDELSSFESQYKALQRKLQKVDAVIAENDMLNSKLIALDKLERENEYLRCKLNQIQEIEENAAEDKQRINQLQSAIADQEEEMKDLLCQIEKLTSGQTEEELQRLRCELYEKNSKLKLCEEQLAEIPMLESEIDELRTKLQSCCREFSEKKPIDTVRQKIEVRYPATSTGIEAKYKGQEPAQSSVLAFRREEKIYLDEKGEEEEMECTKTEAMSCEEVQNLLQSSKEIISCVLEDMLEHQKEMEDLEMCNKEMKDEIQILKAKIGISDRDDLLRELDNYRKIIEEKDLEISRLGQMSSDAQNDTEVNALRELNQQLKTEFEAACVGLREVVKLERALEMEREARCRAEALLIRSGIAVPERTQKRGKRELGDEEVRSHQEGPISPESESMPQSQEDFIVPTHSKQEQEEQEEKEEHEEKEQKEQEKAMSHTEFKSSENLKTPSQYQEIEFSRTFFPSEQELSESTIENLTKGKEKVVINKSGTSFKRLSAEDSNFDCCKILQKETDDLKLQIIELNKLKEELKKENELLRELQQPCPDFSKELDEKCALENLLSLLQAELDAFKGAKLSDECEALRTELKRVMEQNCQLKALVDCYRQRLDLEKKTNELSRAKEEETSSVKTTGTKPETPKEYGSPKVPFRIISELKVTPSGRMITPEPKVTPSTRSVTPEPKVTPSGRTITSEAEDAPIDRTKTFELNDAPIDRTKTSQLQDAPIDRTKTSEPKVTPSGRTITSEAKDAPIDRTETSEAKDAPIDRTETSEAKDAPIDRTETSEAKNAPIDRTETSEAKDAPIDRTKTSEPKVTPSGRTITSEAKDAPIDRTKTSEPKVIRTITSEAKDAPIDRTKTSEPKVIRTITSEAKDAPINRTETSEAKDAPIDRTETSEAKDAPIDRTETSEAKDAPIDRIETSEAKNAPIDRTETSEPKVTPSGKVVADKSQPKVTPSKVVDDKQPGPVSSLKKEDPEKKEVQKEVSKISFPTEVSKEADTSATGNTLKQAKQQPKQTPSKELDKNDELEELRQRLKQMEEECTEKIKKLIEQHEKELANRDKAHNDNLNAMKSGYETDIRKLTERHKLSIMRLQGLHEDEVNELNNNYESQMETMQTQSEEAISDVAKGSAAKIRKIVEQHDQELKSKLGEKESEHQEEMNELRNRLIRSREEVRALRKRAGDEEDGDVAMLKAKHNREMQNIRRGSARKINLLKKKYEDQLKDERKQSDTQIEVLKKKLKESEQGKNVCDCKFSKRKPRKPRDPTLPLDFNEVLEKILDLGMDALTFNEIVLVHQKACCALEGIVMNSNVCPTLEPPVGDACPHTPLLEADKQQLLNRIFKLENEIVLKQRQTQEAIINMEVCVKKERCRLQELKNILQNEQQKNLELKSLLSSQTKLHSDLKKEKDMLGGQASLHQSLCLEKSKQLDQEKRDKKFLEEELEKVKTKVKQLCMALDIERGNAECKEKRELERVQMLRIKLEESTSQERRLASQLDNERKCRIQLQCQLQDLQHSFKQMVNLSAVEEDIRIPQNPFETKSAKEKRNLDQIREKKNKTKSKGLKKQKK